MIKLARRSVQQPLTPFSPLVDNQLMDKGKSVPKTILANFSWETNKSYFIDNPTSCSLFRKSVRQQDGLQMNVTKKFTDVLCRIGTQQNKQMVPRGGQQKAPLSKHKQYIYR